MFKGLFGRLGNIQDRPRPPTPEPAGPASGAHGAPHQQAAAPRGAGRPRPLSPEDEKLVARMSEARNVFKAQYDEYEAGRGPAMTDFMPTMVEAYAKNRPAANARYAKDFGTMLDMVEKDRALLEKAPLHFIAPNGGGEHQTAWRFRSHEGRVVAVGIESLDERAQNMARTAGDFHRLVESRPGLLSAGILVGTGALKSRYNCGAFSMGHLNSFTKHGDHFDGLTRDVARLGKGEAVARLPPGDMGGETGPFRVYGDPEKAYKLLPAHAFKNGQSKADHRDYHRLEPEASAQPVSRHGEDIEARLQRATGLENPLLEAERVDLLRGSDKKRIHMLDSAIDYLQRKPD